MFPFSSEVKLSPEFSVDYKKVHEKIGPLLTAERKQKIDRTVSQRDFDIAVVLENIYDRGNASAVMRTAEAMGYTNIHMVELGEKFKKANRVTQGADKWAEVTRWKSTKDCVLNLKKQGFKICVTHLEASRPIDEIDFSQPTAFVLGNEKDGISPEMVELSDERIIIPMQGFVQSFNISVAGAIGLYHIYQYRKKHLKYPRLNEEEQKILQAHYYIRSLDSAVDILKQT